MARSPNGRPEPDPKRNPVNTNAIFDDPADDDRLRFEEVKVQTRQPFVSVRAGDVPYELKPGDQVVREETGERYEVSNRVREMPGRVKYLLKRVQ